MKPVELSTAFDGQLNTTEWKKGYREGYSSAVKGEKRQNSDTETESYKSGYDCGRTVGACDTV